MSPDPEEEGAMTLWEHLGELRSRLVKMIFFFLIGAGAAWYYRTDLLDVIKQPFVDSWPADVAGGHASLHFQTPASGFIAYVKLAALSGLVFSMPVIIYQLWAFVAPGLYRKEKRFAIPFVVSSMTLFVAGGYFCFKFAFPPAFRFLLSMGGNDLVPTVMLDEYISFVTNMMLAFGFAAELPVVAFFLSFIGVVTYKDLIKFFRYWIVISFVIAAIVTPPDPLSQLMLAIPLCALYGVSIVVAWLFGKKKKLSELGSPTARS
jgi:sec-independent protein translocase protein TatC